MSSGSAHRAAQRQRHSLSGQLQSVWWGGACPTTLWLCAQRCAHPLKQPRAGLLHAISGTQQRAHTCMCKCLETGGVHAPCPRAPTHAAGVHLQWQLRAAQELGARADVGVPAHVSDARVLTLWGRQVAVGG